MFDKLDWVRQPYLAPGGFKDSLAYVGAVHAIFMQARMKDAIIASQIRDLLTYLLLRRNPATDVSVVLDHMPEGSEGVVPEDVQMIKESTYRSLDRYIKGEASQPYSVLMLIQKMNANPVQNWANPEEFALLILSMWLFTKEVDTADISTQRSCLRLYFDSVSYKCRGREREFMNSDVRYGTWLNEEIERLFFEIEDTKSLLQELTYVGSFASLLRAARMVEDDHPLKEVLRDEIAWLQDKTTLN